MNISKNKNAIFTAFGEVMMRLNCASGKRMTDPGAFDVLYGGAEANVCVFLSGLNRSTRLISRLPENDLALGAIDRLRSHGVDTSGIVSGNGRMGLYFTENGNMLRPSRVIYDRKDSSFFKIEKGMIDWHRALEGAGWFHWSGITTAISGGAAAVCLEAVQTAKQMGIPISADLNYRSSLWDYGSHPSNVMPEFISYCDVVIGDLHAASIYFGIPINKEWSSDDQFRTCAEAMKTKFGSLQALAFSFRNHDEQQRETYLGAMLLDDQFYFSPRHSIPLVIDRIGSGDAFTAGLIYSIREEFSPQEIIGFATGCGILKHSVYGDFARITQKEVNHFIEHGPGNRVIR